MNFIKEINKYHVVSVIIGTAAVIGVGIAIMNKPDGALMTALIGGNTAPTVILTNPTANAVFASGTTVTLSADASDSDGSIIKVEFFVNGIKFGEDRTVPYSFSIPNVVTGSYRVTAKAIDNKYAVTTSSAVTATVSAKIPVTVPTTVSRNISPSVSVTSSVTTAAAPASITLTALASDSDGTVSKVSFYNGSTKLGEDSSKPFTYVWNSVPVGSYSITAKAVDDDFATTTSLETSVTVSNAVTEPAVTKTTSNGKGLGFNIPWMFGALNNAPATAMSELAESTKYMNQPMFRFPGGTTSRAYHINLPGFDGRQPGATENYIIPFTKAFSPAATPGLVQVSAVLNVDDHFTHIVYHGSDEDLINDNINMIKYLLDHGFKVPLIEFGNELTATPELFWRYNDTPFVPITTIDQNVRNLFDIKLAHPTDKTYQEAHFKDGLDKYESLFSTYKTRINALYTARGLSLPQYGIPVANISNGGTYYGDTAFFQDYWNKRVRDMDNRVRVDAYIPHYYKDFTPGEGGNTVPNLTIVIRELHTFFDNKPLWFTEFNSAPIVNNSYVSDTQEQVTVLDQITTLFDRNNVPYYMYHRYFDDTGGFGMIYKILKPSSNPVNGTGTGTSTIADSTYGKKLYYSPVFCWAIKERGASTATYRAAMNAYGCN